MRNVISISLLVLVFGAGLASAGENWPQWRGPEGNGTTDAEGLAVTWSETENIIWRTPLPGWSGATPVVWGDRIFLHSPGAGGAQGDANPREGYRKMFQPVGGRSAGSRLSLLLCIDVADGKTLWTRQLDESNELLGKQNMTSPSPATDGEHVWSMTGNGELTCFDMDGTEIWRRNIQDDYGKFGINWGYAASPLLYHDRLIVAVLHGFKTNDPSYVLAVDKLTGKTLWKTERVTNAVAESPDAYSTPQIWSGAGADQIIINGADVVTGHDPADGAELWRIGGLNPGKGKNYRIVASPVISAGMIFAPSRRNPLLALAPAGEGNPPALAWKTKRGPDVPTPVSDGEYLYIIDDRGVVWCHDAKTGELIYKERTATGTFSGSAVLADGKIYANAENGQTIVLAASPEFELLAINQLDDDYTLASPVIAGGRIYIRTSTALYCIADSVGP